MRVLVTGATGTMGTVLSDILGVFGCEVIRSAPKLPAEPGNRPFDVSGFAGFYEVLQGIDTLVCLHHDITRPELVDGRGTQKLAASAAKAGVQHIVLLSRVGAGKIPAPEYEAKQLAEEAVAASGTGWTVLRSTAFHSSVYRVAQQRTKGRIIGVPKGWHTQPIDPAAVVQRLSEIVRGEPLGLTREIAGPEKLSMAAICRTVAKPRKLMIVNVRATTAYEQAMARGENLPGLAPDVRGATFNEWLTETRRLGG